MDRSIKLKNWSKLIACFGSSVEETYPKSLSNSVSATRVHMSQLPSRASLCRLWAASAPHHFQSVGWIHGHIQMSHLLLLIDVFLSTNNKSIAVWEIIVVDENKYWCLHVKKSKIKTKNCLILSGKCLSPFGNDDSLPGGHLIFMWKKI